MIKFERAIKILFFDSVKLCLSFLFFIFSYYYELMIRNDCNKFDCA